MKNQRLIWADTLRGLLILLVVLGHSLQHGDYENRIAWNIIYSFHMAAFFVISGFVGYKESYKMSSLTGKTRQLLLPFMSWTIIETLINGVGLSRFSNVLLHPDISYWFVYVLFVILFLFTLIVVICQNLSLKNDYMLWGGGISLVIVMVLTEFRLFGFQFISLYFGFYVLGYMLNKYKVKIPATCVTVLGVLWMTMALFWRMHAVPAPLQWATSYFPASLLTYSYRYIVALLGSLFFIGFAMQSLNTDNWICRTLTYFGNVSLGIYIVHLFLAKFVEPMYIGCFSSDTSLMFVILDFVIKLSLSTIIVHIIQSIPLVRTILLGKK